MRCDGTLFVCVCVLCEMLLIIGPVNDNLSLLSKIKATLPYDSKIRVSQTGAVITG